MSKWHGGKGSAPRPYSVTQEEYDNRWDAIFGRKPATEESLCGSTTADTDDEDNDSDSVDLDEDTENDEST